MCFIVFAKPTIEDGVNGISVSAYVPEQCYISLGCARRDADHEATLRYLNSLHIFTYESVYIQRERERDTHNKDM